LTIASVVRTHWYPTSSLGGIGAGPYAITEELVLRVRVRLVRTSSAALLFDKEAVRAHDQVL
jgi:hypothetical protein